MSQICRTCLEVYENGCQLFSLEINEPMFDRIHIKTKLEACVPEIALHRVRNPAICRYCLFALNTAYDFKTKCLQTETRIYNYMTTETIDSHDLNRIVKRNTNNIFNCDMINQNSQRNGESRILLSPLSLLPPPPTAPYPPMPPPPTLPTLSSLQSLSAPRPTIQSRPPSQVQTDTFFQTRSPLLDGALRSTGTMFQGLDGPPRPTDLHPRLQVESGPQIVQSRGHLEQRLQQVGASFSEGFQGGSPFPQTSPRFQERPPYFTSGSGYHDGQPFSQGSSISTGPRYHQGPPFSQGPRYQGPQFLQGPTGPRFQIGPPFQQNSIPRFQVPGSSLSSGMQLQIRPPFSEGTRFQVGPTFSQGSAMHTGFRYPPFSQGPPLSANPRLQMGSPLHSIRQYQQQQQPTGSLFHGGPLILESPRLQANSIGLERPPVSTVTSTPNNVSLQPQGVLFQSESPRLDGSLQLKGLPLSVGHQLQTRPPLPDIPALPKDPQLQTGPPLSEESPSQSSDSLLPTSPTVPADSQLPTSQQLTFPSLTSSFSNTSSPLLSYRLSENGSNTFLLFGAGITPTYKCSVCQQCFTSNNLLKEHMNYHINPDGLKCSMCDFQTNSTVCLDEHLKTHDTSLVAMDTSTPTADIPSTESSYKCFNCNYSTTDKNSFKEHRATHVGESVHQCGLCNFRSTHSSSLRRHMKVHMGDRPFRCTECRYGAADEISIQIHMKIHKKERPHKCSDCPFSALKRSKLKIHLLRCHGKVFVPNNQENEDPSSSTVDPYQVSLDDIHNILQGEDDSLDTPECSTIKEATNTEPEITQDPYMITVEDIQKILQRKDENDNENEILNTGTGQNDNIVDANTGKVFRCSTCKQQFNYIYLLRRHMVIHSSNNKPLDCPKCDFRTTIKSHLQVHLKTHTGGKVYRCEKCEYSTIYWSNIQKHHRVHTGEKPYKCSVCDYKASQQTTLKAHMNTHVENSSFECTRCSYTSNTEEELLTHIEMHSIGGHFLEDGISNNFIEDSIKRHFALNNITKNLSNLSEEHSQLTLEGLSGEKPSKLPSKGSSSDTPQPTPEGLSAGEPSQVALKAPNAEEPSKDQGTEEGLSANLIHKASNKEFIPESTQNNCVVNESSQSCNNVSPGGLSSDVIQGTSNNECIQESSNEMITELRNNCVPECITQESPRIINNFVPDHLENGFVPEGPINNLKSSSAGTPNNIVQEVLSKNNFIQETPCSPKPLKSNIGSNNFVDDPFNSSSFIQEAPNFIQESQNNKERSSSGFLHVFNPNSFIQQSHNSDYFTRTSNNFVHEVFNSNFIQEACNNSLSQRSRNPNSNDGIIRETANNSYVHDIFNPSSNFVPQALGNSVISESYKRNEYVEGVVSDKITSKMNFVPQEGTT